MRGNVLVAMSGGVDSSVAAMLLQDKGYNVAGATFRLWDGGESAIEDAKHVCDHLKIEHYILDYRDRFQTEVVERFAEEYRLGRTPNPCIFCNRAIKFGAFYDDALALGYTHIATGHYVRTEYNQSLGRVRLCRGASYSKDQSYVLYVLDQPRLAAFLAPLGTMEKGDVRRIAIERRLPVAQKIDSQDICFIPDGDYPAWLEQNAGFSPEAGTFVDESGKVLGAHHGHWRYTIGQRRGLGIGFGKPVYVQSTDPNTNTVTLGSNKALMRQDLVAEQLNWIDIPRLEAARRLHARIRYAHVPAPALLQPDGDDRVLVHFDDPQRAITPGQAVVFYDGDYVVGGGVIQKS